ncbi:MAG: hypothetical protein GW947_02895 [Candidatus Pacebacteria bacterium]|nr:hypothetical protein [Candidatus Paceibacterota bacterium]PIR59493.1 MAG: hypothetical protein COU68_05315 [Candidatus Pacebacteria bacterium CG10_big_fil_rev_8_21_14_0_10_45_6]
MRKLFVSTTFPLYLILLVALVLRIPLLTGSFWLDEAAQALESTRPLSQQLDIVADFQPPLLHLVTHFASYFSTAEWWLRTVGALIPGLVTIAFSYVLLLRAANKKTAIIGSLLLSTSSLHIYFSQELRPYALPAMFAVISWWALYEKRWRSFTASTILGLYSSYLFPFLLFSQLVWQLVVVKEKRREFFSSIALSAALFAPWLPMFFAQLQTGQLLRHDLPGWDTVVSVPQEKALQLVFAKFIFGLSDLSLSPTYLLIAGLIGLGIAFLCIHFWPKTPSKKRRLLALLLLWTGLPLLVGWLVSWIIPVIEPKRLLLSLAGFYGLAAYLSVLAAQQKSRAVAWTGHILIATLLTLTIWSTTNYYTNAKLQREDWRGSIAKIEQTYPTQDTVALFIFPDPFAPWRWYADPKIKTLTTKTIFITKDTQLRDLLEPTLDYTYLVVFDYLQDLTDPNRLVRAELEKFGFRETGSFSTENLGFVRIFTNKQTMENNG